MVPDTETRSSTELYVKTFSTLLFASASYGHLGSLLNLPPGQHAYKVLLFWICPLIIFVDPIKGLYNLWVTRHASGLAHPTPGLSTLKYWLHVILGVCVEPPPDSLPNAGSSRSEQPSPSHPLSLVLYDCGDLRPAGPRISFRLIGRLLVAAASTAQGVGSFILFIRRADGDLGLRLFDIMAGIAGLHSAYSGAMTVVLLVTGHEWQATAGPRGERVAVTSTRMDPKVHFIVWVVFTGWVGTIAALLSDPDVKRPWRTLALLHGWALACFLAVRVRLTSTATRTWDWDLPAAKDWFAGCLACLLLLPFLLLSGTSEVKQLGPGRKDSLADELFVK